MDTQNKIQGTWRHHAEHHGWRIASTEEWVERACPALKGDGTYFVQEKSNTWYASNKTGEAAWLDLCDTFTLE